MIEKYELENFTPKKINSIRKKYNRIYTTIK